MDTLGQTALHRAALAGHIQTCKLLLSFGADPSIVSLQGFTAAQMGNEAVQQILNGNQTRCTSNCFKWFAFSFGVFFVLFFFDFVFSPENGNAIPTYELYSAQIRQILLSEVCVSLQ